MDDGLFPAEPYATTSAAEPAEQLSAGRRLTLRQADAVRRGAHPLAGVRPTVRIHPDADPGRIASPDNAVSRPLRCGTCRWRMALGGHASDYPKCGWRPPTDRPNEYGRYRTAPPRYSAGAATDVRAWWPACADWQPREVQ